MPIEKKKPQKSIGEQLAAKEPMGEGDRTIVASLIDNLNAMANASDEQFQLEFTKQFVSKYWDGASFDSNMVSSLLLAISAMRDSGKISVAKMKRLTILEEWLKDIRGT